jgi:hypothetical protein
MLKDHTRQSLETGRQTHGSTALLAAGPSSLELETERPRRRLRTLGGYCYIMAAGGAGSSGLPALESGNRTSRTPSSTITAEPKR